MKRKRKDDKMRVSIWVGFRKADPEADVLKDLCGVRYYDVDFQELIVDDRKWKKQPIRKLLQELSYSSSFLDEALGVASKNGITEALYVVAQYHFVYHPNRIKKKAADPKFLGCFEYNDHESAEFYAEVLEVLRKFRERRGAVKRRSPS